MAIEGGGVELREDVDLVDGAVDTVAHWNIDESVSAADRHLPRHHDHAPSSQRCFTLQHKITSRAEAALNACHNCSLDCKYMD